MVATMEMPQTHNPLFDENSAIPRELNPRGRVFELNTIGDARQALARLRELRRDFDTGSKRNRTGDGKHDSMVSAGTLRGSGEDMLAGLSNIQRMRTIRSEIAYLEDLMVRIAAREFELQENMHHSYLAGIGQWSERHGRFARMS